jgi:hypothetical protein
MNNLDTQDPGEDTTMTVLETLRDGTVQGFVKYHRMRSDLLAIRSLPEAPPPPVGTAELAVARPSAALFAQGARVRTRPDSDARASAPGRGIASRRDPVLGLAGEGARRDGGAEPGSSGAIRVSIRELSFVGTPGVQRRRGS